MKNTGIVYADKGQIDELVEIWQKSFGDSEVYVRIFLDENFDRMKVPVYEVKGHIVSVAYLLPVTYCDGAGLETPCYYLYAAATHPEYRGRGYFAKLLQNIDAYIPEPVLLVPDGAGLADYYKKQGLYVWQEQSIAAASRYDLGLESAEDKSFCEEISFQEYYEMREACLAGKPHIRWSPDFMEYICKENAFGGGKQIKIKFQGLEYLIMYRISEGVVEIQEILPQKNYKKVVQILLYYLLYKRAVVCLKPLTMASAKLLGLEKGYFNLTMG